MYNIVTSIAVDKDPIDQHILYGNLGKQNKKVKKFAYWKTAFNFFATSTKINKGQKHILYTNDEEGVFLNEIDLRERISQLGVEIVFLPFERFVIPNQLTKQYKNAYYKFEVIKELSKLDNPSMLLDTDCIFVNKIDCFESMIWKNGLMIYDHLQHNPNPASGIVLGNLFKKIDSKYPSIKPIQFGGEFVAATPEVFKQLIHQIEDIFEKMLEKAADGFNPRLPTGESMLDGDEYIASYIYNKGYFTYLEASNFIKRCYSIFREDNATRKDLELSIWHVPSEKLSGLDILFWEIINTQSKFWFMAEEDLPSFYGKYVGIPKRNVLKKLYLKGRRKLLYGNFYMTLA